MPKTYATYILTNWNKTVLYVGMTNNLPIRLVEHFIGEAHHFTKRYRVFQLVWFQETKYVLNAIAQEKEIKRMTRVQKEALIKEFNPEWIFLNEKVLGNWPPTNEQIVEAIMRSKEPRNKR